MTKPKLKTVEERKSAAMGKLYYLTGAKQRAEEDKALDAKHHNGRIADLEDQINGVMDEIAALNRPLPLFDKEDKKKEGEKKKEEDKKPAPDAKVLVTPPKPEEKKKSIA
jgi:hypothetical protein